jgi:predicted N-acetyltransferase YhbS
MDHNAQYLPDDTIDAALDAEIRGLLTTCFTKPEDVVFRTRRHFVEPYPHRWIIRDPQGRLVAHIGVHEKCAEVDGRTARIGGIAEVCVHPDCRGRGYVKQMLGCVHDWLRQHGFAFAVLYGDPKVYSSSGYRLVDNLAYSGDEGGWLPTSGMVLALTNQPWPTAEVRIPGKKF